MKPTPKESIRFEGADLSYGKSAVLRGVSCSITAGQSVGLVGQNGSGKTTFLRAVLGLLRPKRGTVQSDRSLRFAYVPQVENLNYFLPLTVRDVVFLPWRANAWGGRITDQQRGWAESAMEKTGAADFQHRLLRECSGGQRQRAILAQALSQKPDVLLLDEPTRGLDVVAERDLLALILDLKTSENLTILFVTHSLQIPLNFMEKILLFHEGAVIPTTPDELVHTNRLEEIYGVPFLHHEAHGFRWVLPKEKG